MSLEKVKEIYFKVMKEYDLEPKLLTKDNCWEKDNNVLMLDAALTHFPIFSGRAHERLPRSKRGRQGRPLADAFYINVMFKESRRRKSVFEPSEIRAKSV